MIRSLVISLALLALSVNQAHANHNTPSPAGAMLLAQQASPPPASAPAFTEVAAILNDSCILCHAPPAPASGLRLDNYEGLMKGGKSGPAVVPGKPEESEIIRRLRGLREPRMPFSGPPWLSDEKTGVIEQWIKAGAKEGGSPSAQGQPQAEPVAAAASEPQQVRYGQVSPIFASRCVKCHAAKGQLGPPPEGIRMDSYEAVIQGGERPILIPGVPGASPLLRSLLGQSRPRMPMDGPPYLDAGETDLIAIWIKDGAPNNSGVTAPVPVGARIRLGGTLTDHWALDGTPFLVDGKTRIKKKPTVGAYVEVRAVVAALGEVHATEIRTR